MPNATQLSKLFTCLSSGNIDGALEVAYSIADHEDKCGHRVAARTLRGALNRNSPTHRREAPRFLNSFIAEPEGPLLGDVVLQKTAREVLDRVVLEWKHRQELDIAGIPRRRRLLFWGPPGCGKTLTARALGRELALPVYSVRLSSIIGSYLGQTGTNLQQVFASTRQHPMVLLLDELDAIGATRGQGDDIREIDRVIVTLLQEFDHSQTSGIIIAATNLEGLIDPALWRRFDLTLKFPYPSKNARVKFVKKRMREFQVRSPSTIAKSEKTVSFSEIESLVQNIRREKFLRKLMRQS